MTANVLKGASCSSTFSPTTRTAKCDMLNWLPPALVSFEDCAVVESDDRNVNFASHELDGFSARDSTFFAFMFREWLVCWGAHGAYANALTDLKITHLISYSE